MYILFISFNDAYVHLSRFILIDVEVYIMHTYVNISYSFYFHISWIRSIWHVLLRTTYYVLRITYYVLWTFSSWVVTRHHVSTCRWRLMPTDEKEAEQQMSGPTTLPGGWGYGRGDMIIEWWSTRVCNNMGEDKSFLLSFLSWLSYQPCTKLSTQNTTQQKLSHID